MEWVGLSIIVAFLFITRRSMVYAAVFIEIFPRLTISLISAMTYASTYTKLYEFNYYSTPNINVVICLISLISVSLYIFYYHARMLNKIIDTSNLKLMNVSFIEKISIYIMIIIIMYFIFEVRSIGIFGVDLTISKRNYMDFVSNPFLFKVLHALYPIFFLFLASFIVKKARAGEKIPLPFIALLIIVFIMMIVFYLLLQQKSFIIRIPMVFFFAPLLIYFSKTLNLNSKLTGLAIVGLLGLYAAFAYQYREVLSLLEVPGAIMNRLLIEGQLNYLNIDVALSPGMKLDFFQYFGPFLDPEAAMFELIYSFARDDLHFRASIDQWTASGLMPGFIFRVDFWPLYFTIWLCVFWFCGHVFLNAYKRFMLGDVLSCFIGIKLSLILFQFVAQGLNFVSSISFWAYLIAYILSSSLYGRVRIPLLHSVARS